MWHLRLKAFTVWHKFIVTTNLFSNYVLPSKYKSINIREKINQFKFPKANFIRGTVWEKQLPYQSSRLRTREGAVHSISSVIAWEAINLPQLCWQGINIQRLTGFQLSSSVLFGASDHPNKTLKSRFLQLCNPYTCAVIWQICVVLFFFLLLLSEELSPSCPWKHKQTHEGRYICEPLHSRLFPPCRAGRSVQMSLTHNELTPSSVLQQRFC